MTVSTAIAAPDSAAPLQPRLVVPTSFLSTQSMSLSPDGSLMVTTHNGRAVMIREVASGRQLRTFTGFAWRDGQGGGVHAAFAPDGLSLVTADNDSVQWWDLRSGALKQTIAIENQAATAIVVAPDGLSAVVAVLDRNRMRRFELATGREMAVYRSTGYDVQSIAFSPDGRTLVSGGQSKAVIVWDAASGAQRSVLKGHGSTVFSVALAPDGHTVASASLDGTVGLWDTEQPQQVDSIDPRHGGAFAVAFSKDGSRLAAAFADQVMVWDQATHQLVGALEPGGNGEDRWHVGIAFASNDELIGATRADMVLWNIATRQPVRRFAVAPAMNADRVAFGADGGALLIQDMRWDLEGAAAPALIAPLGGRLASLCAISVDARYVAYETRGKIDVLDLQSGARSASTPGKCDRSARALSPDGRSLLAWDGDGLSLRKAGSDKAIALAGSVDKQGISAWSPDGRSVLSATEAGTVRIWSAENGRLLRQLTTKGGGITSAAFSPDSTRIAIGNESGEVQVLSANGGAAATVMKAHREWVRGIAWTPDGTSIVSGGDDGVVKVWSIATRKERTHIAAHLLQINALAVSPNGKTIVSTSYDGTTRLWRTMDGSAIATIVWFQNDQWAVVAPDGRFDASDLEQVGSLYWLLPNAPLSPLPLEALMKEFYQPGLLGQLMNGVQRAATTPTLGDVIGTQPVVKIIEAKPGPQRSQTMRVTVEVAGAPAKPGARAGTGAHDLRLMRDGQLVASVPGVLTTSDGTPWRNTFEIALPSFQDYKRVNFSAYAFSDQRVKSETARLQTDFQQAPVAHRDARAYILSIGVNRHDDPAWDLSFAANDARALRASLQTGLARAGGYAEIVAIQLVSDQDDRSASKANIHAVLDRLAGKASAAELARIPGAERLQRATPDDLVVVTFAGHGYADNAGRFYLLTPDTGPSTGRRFSDDLKQRSVSSDELGDWLRDIDAGDIAMVLDACHSAASVDSGEFKPGPMGSKGLGQLAFDKGIRLLAASQADQAALESNRLSQGFLSFALASEGLDRFLADQSPKDGRIDIGEWLRYGAKRVPELALAMSGGAAKAFEAPRGAELVTASPAAAAAPVQKPVLFDFRRTEKPVVIDIKRE